MSEEDCKEIEKILWSDQTADFQEVSSILGKRNICALSVMYHPFFHSTDKLRHQTFKVMARVFVLNQYKKLKEIA